MFTRRFFLRASAVAMAGVGVAPSWLVRAAAEGGNKRKILVAIFQRGAADGLNVVVPFFEKLYYELRPTIAVPAPGKNNGAIDLDGRFGLHPSLQPLKPFWDSGQLAIVEATGSPDPTRSHFDAQDFMESGTPGKMSEDGWLNRALPPAGPAVSPLRAIAIGTQLPRTLRGSRPQSPSTTSINFRCAIRTPPGFSRACTRQRRTRSSWPRERRRSRQSK